MTEPLKKIVVFKLSKNMTFPEMVKAGHRPHEVTALFEQLQVAGYGLYTPGRPGRGGAARFEANDKCPEKFTIGFVVKALRTNYKGKPEEDINTEEKPQVITNVAINKILSIPRTPEKKQECLGFGYICSIANGYLFVDRFDGFGFPSIADAVSDVWNVVHNDISAKGTSQMSPKEEVESSLMGLGFYKLSK